MSRTVILHLSLIPGAGPATIERIINAWTYDQLIDLYLASARDIHERTGLSMMISDNIVKGLAQRSLLEAELELIAQHAVDFVCLYDDDYPALLRASYLPPAVLYWRGKHPATCKKALAFVGSRKANAYGARAARAIVKPLAEMGFCIVSGGALGADTLAHKIALEAKGTTSAIIGAGLLSPYPAQNRNLFNAIVDQGGSVMSPFPLLMEALPANFPARNRIIAGLSQACIVLQAADRSGALITARFALEFGREVGAVPGAIDDELSAGCHKLIAQGAHLISSADDVLEALGLIGPVLETSLSPIERNLEIIPAEETLEETIVRWCKKPSTFDDILVKSQLEASQLHETLFTLQLSGKIMQDYRGLWQSMG
jgi:DNA processing protein